MKGSLVVFAKQLRTKMNKNRKIGTGLSGTANKAILDSVIGQMSDGMWENTPAMRKYWAHCDIVEEGGQLFLAVDDGYDSGFSGKDDAWIKAFFAQKIKQIVYEETGGAQWNRADTTELGYLGRSGSPVTVSQAYKAYEILKGRKIAGRYAEGLSIDRLLGEEAAGK